jgi:flagellar motor switch protein FliN/FliY
MGRYMPDPEPEQQEQPSTSESAPPEAPAQPEPKQPLSQTDLNEAIAASVLSGGLGEHAQADTDDSYSATAVLDDPAGAAVHAMPYEIPELGSGQSAGSPMQGIDLLRDVELDVKIELGRSRMLVDEVLRLGEGSVVELDKLAGDPVDVFVNNRLVARGEVLVLNDNFCVRINEIISRNPEEEQVQ